MKIILILITTLVCSAASAAQFDRVDHEGRAGNTKLELAQLEAIKNALASELGLNAEVRMSSGFLAVKSSITGIFGTLVSAVNLVRKPENRVSGIGSLDVVIDTGFAGYTCRAFAEFRGEPIQANLTGVRLDGCDLFFTKAADAQYLECIKAKVRYQAPACTTPMRVLVPSALHINVDR